ncbi:MAG: hypothetical protein ACI8W8_004922, partial [Rhodothermales bacterium]
FQENDTLMSRGQLTLKGGKSLCWGLPDLLCCCRVQLGGIGHTVKLPGNWKANLPRSREAILSTGPLCDEGFVEFADECVHLALEELVHTPEAAFRIERGIVQVLA